MAHFDFPKNLKPIETLDPRLRQPSVEVTKDLIGNKNFQQLLDDMIDYVYGHKRSKKNATDGKPNVIGLAAVQLGINLRVCVVDVALNMPDNLKDKYHEMRILINPKIITISKERDNDLESCVSCPEMWATVSRPKIITIDAWDRWGNKIRMDGKDWVAKLFQHEIDHMNGTLFIDRVLENKIHWVKDGEELKNYRTDEDWKKIVPPERYGFKKFIKD